MALAQMLTPVLDLLFPPRCPACGSGVAEQGGLCAACWNGLRFPGAPNCRLCLHPLPIGGEEECADCRQAPPAHDGIHSATLYTPASRGLVLALKRGRRIALAPLLARLMAARLPALEGEWLVVPVPLHRWRLWGRGFNQSALLARELARLRGMDLAVDALTRHRATPSLGQRGAQERARLLDGAISPRLKARLAGAQVVLVDDVMTSGATTNACIAALRQAGAQRVVVACFARALTGAERHRPAAAESETADDGAKPG